MRTGRSLLSRSFKYHRPRGVLTMAGQDANTMVQVGAEPNVRGDRHAIADGMAVTSINRIGPARSRLAVPCIGLFRASCPSASTTRRSSARTAPGRLFERPIRSAGRPRHARPGAPHHGYYDKAYLFADVLVVGGGPAGLEAAIAAAEAGAEVLLIDEWPQLGGSLLFGRDDGEPRRSRHRAAQPAVARVAPSPACAS